MPFDINQRKTILIATENKNVLTESLNDGIVSKTTGIDYCQENLQKANDLRITFDNKETEINIFPKYVKPEFYNSVKYTVVNIELPSHPVIKTSSRHNVSFIKVCH